MTPKLQIICKTCGKLSDFNARGMCQPCYHKWYYKIQTELNQRICNVCGQKRTHHSKGMCRQCYLAARDPEARQAERINRIHKKGKQTLSENKECSMYLGVHIAERILAKVFSNVKRMNPQNPGYDFICNKGMKIDVKSSCTRVRKNRPPQWSFVIKRNKIADYFLCIAFDNRKDLNPLHLWLIDGNKINSYKGTSISKTTINKWDKFKLPLDSVISCCDSLKQKGVNNEK